MREKEFNSNIPSMKANNVSDLILTLGGASSVADACGVTAWAVRKWMSKNVVPPNQWSNVVTLAAEKGVSDVSYQWLASFEGKAA